MEGSKRTEACFPGKRVRITASRRCAVISMVLNTTSISSGAMVPSPFKSIMEKICTVGHRIRLSEISTR